MSTPDKALLREQKESILDCIYQYHLRDWNGSDGKIFFISDTYPGVWMEHTFDSIVWGAYEPSQHEISRNQVRLFLNWQKPDGQFPCYVWKNEVGYGWTQEGVSFGSLCLEAVRLNPQDTSLLQDCYRACKSWDEWLCKTHMTRKTGLIEMFCGYDTGHDNSCRVNDLSYPGEFCPDGNIVPKDDTLLPILAPDMNAIFYGNRIALAEMAEKLNLPQEAAQWRTKAEDVKKKLFEYCYNEEDQFFYEKASAKHDKLEAEIARRNNKARQLASFIDHLEKAPASLEEWDSQVWSLLLEKGTVNRDGSVAFEFRNGKEIKVEAK